jgi:hypothetical protein
LHINPWMSQIWEPCGKINTQTDILDSILTKSILQRLYSTWLKGNFLTKMTS